MLAYLTLLDTCFLADEPPDALALHLHERKGDTRCNCQECDINSKGHQVLHPFISLIKTKDELQFESGWVNGNMGCSGKAYQLPSSRVIHGTKSCGNPDNDGKYKT